MALFKINPKLFLNPYKPLLIEIKNDDEATLTLEDGSYKHIEGPGVANLAAWLEDQKAPDYVTKRVRTRNAPSSEIPKTFGGI